MSDEAAFLDLLRALAVDPGARGFLDDAAVLAIGGAQLVLTSDTLVEGVHFRSDDPAETVGWKLAAVNLSDLAAKGARPRGCLMNYTLSGDTDWDAAFVRGLGAALEDSGMALLGGDTVAGPAGTARSFTLTAIGEADGAVPARGGARVGDVLYVTGPVGDAGAGLALRNAGDAEPAALIDAYRRPKPRLAEGRALAPVAHAMMDVSDGLLIDARRMAAASGVGVVIDHVPLSAELVALKGESVVARIAAATAGDDYELLVALPEGVAPPVDLIAVGRCVEGEGLSMMLDGVAVPLPERLGYQHG